MCVCGAGAPWLMRYRSLCSQWCMMCWSEFVYAFWASFGLAPKLCILAAELDMKFINGKLYVSAQFRGREDTWDILAGTFMAICTG